MEGLEVSVINLEVVRRDNRVFRYDTQYYSKAALAVESRIKKGKWDELVNLTDGVESFGAYALTNEFSYQESGVPFLRCVNIRGGFTDFGDVLYIDDAANKLLAKSEVKPEMVLLTMSGSVGNAAVALSTWTYPVNSNQDIAKISPKSGVNPYYIAAFLSSKYGAIQMERLPVGSVQQHIFLWMIEKLAISRFSSKLEHKIGEIMLQAYQCEADSVTIGAQAEQTLLQALGLEGWEPPEPLTYTRRASEVLPEKHLDSEYYRPRFDAIRSKLAQKHKTMSLGRMGEVLKGWSVPYDEDGTIPIIRSGDLSDISNDDRFLRAAETEDVFELERGDVLISSIGFGSIGKVQMFDKAGKYGTVSEVTVVRQKTVKPQYLASFLRSWAGQTQIEQFITGATGQLHLYPRDVAKIEVPLVDVYIQNELEELATKSATSRQQAQSLLESAKRAVEVAIEEGEAAALAWLASVKSPSPAKKISAPVS